MKDNGQGISKEGMKNLFKRFYEGDYRRFNTTGTGIGLSLGKDLVTLHEGTIRVVSEEGQGATFIGTYRERSHPGDRVERYRPDRLRRNDAGDERSGTMPLRER